MLSKGYKRRLRANRAGLLFECIYCADVVGLDNFTIEHIWANAIGGEYGPDWFKTIFICELCNSHCGIHVDGEYLLNFVTSAEAVSSALTFLDTGRVAPLPLVYLGRSAADSVKAGEVCEFWLGPRGEAIYHFRHKDDTYFDTHAGGNPIRRRTNPGRVYMSLTNPNLYWVVTALRSLKAKFGRMELFSLTQIEDERLNRLFKPRDARAAADMALIAGLQANGHHRAVMSFNMNFGQRYLCKLALGFGFQLFGYDFLQLPGTAMLRAALRADNAHLEQLDLHGATVFQSTGTPNLLHFAGAYLLVFFREGPLAGLTVITPTGRDMAVRFTDAADRLRSPLFDRYGGPFCVLLVPTLKRHWGPYPLRDYIDHKLGKSNIPDLSELEGLRRTMAQIEGAISIYPVGRAA